MVAYWLFNDLSIKTAEVVRVRRLLAALMIVLMNLAGACACFAQDEPSFAVGQLSHTPDTFMGSPIHINRNQVVEAAGGELITAYYADESSESIIHGVKTLIERGCDGIILTPTSDEALPQVMRLCDDAGVYWIISLRPVNDPGTRALLESSKYFVGVVMQDDRVAGYELMRLLGENGMRNVAVFSISKLNSAGESRERGIYLAAQECDMRVVAEVRNLASEEEVDKAVRAIRAAYPELDAIFGVASSFVRVQTSTLKSIEGTGLGYVSIDYDPSMAPYFDDGAILGVAGGNAGLISAFSSALLVNAVTGHPVSDEPVWLTVPYRMFFTAEDFRENMARDTTTPVFSPDSARRLLLKAHTPSLSLGDYESIMEAFQRDELEALLTEP